MYIPDERMETPTIPTSWQRRDYPHQSSTLTLIRKQTFPAEINFITIVIGGGILNAPLNKEF